MLPTHASRYPKVASDPRSSRSSDGENTMRLLIRAFGHGSALILLLALPVTPGRAQLAAARRDMSTDGAFIIYGKQLLQERLGPAASAIIINSHQGVVTLTGLVPTMQAKQLAEESIKGVAGVTAVKDQLVVDTRVTTTTTPPRLLADIAFPLDNGGATIAGKPVGWSRAVTLTSQDAKRIENYRCVFDLTYHVSNVGSAPAGPFSDMVRAVPLSAGPAPQNPVTEQTGLNIDPKATKALKTEVAIAPGSWFVVVKGDAAGQVKELDELGNNEGRFRVTVQGTCDGTIWGAHEADYRSYLLQHLLVKSLSVAGKSALPGGRVRLDANNVQGFGNGRCQVPIAYLLENHGGLATQPFTSVVEVGGSPPTLLKVAIPALAPGTGAPAHAVVGFPEGSSLLQVHPVQVSYATGEEQYGSNGLETTVVVDASCQRK
jgi:BON domain